MTKLTITSRLILTGSSTLLMVGILIWEYTHGGVVRHYLLHDENMPSISNWWGLLIIPVFSGFTSDRIFHKNTPESKQKVVARGCALFLFGIIVSIIFGMDPESPIPGYMFLGVFPISIFLPIYRAECLLGYVTGMLFTFGAFIPVVSGLIFWALFYGLYKGPRAILSHIKRR